LANVVHRVGFEEREARLVVRHEDGAEVADGDALGG
jgi:hypothetical protein